MMKFNVGAELNKNYVENMLKDFPSAKPTTSLRGLLKNANKSIVNVVEHRSKVIKLD